MHLVAKFSTLKSNPDLLKRAHSPQRRLLCANQDPQKRAYPTECCIMKRIDEECYMKANFLTPDPKSKLYTTLLCSNPDLPKLIHSPKGMLLLIDPTGCCVMKRKDKECHIQAITRDPDPEVKVYHRGAYQQYLGKTVADIDYVWRDNKSMINSSIGSKAKLHARHNILLFHHVRSMISQRYINLQHLALKWNFSYILTKCWIMR